MQTTSHVPVAQGLFRGEGRDARLIGSRCAGCGAHYFPQSAGCRNPACTDGRMTEALLSPRGVLYSYTVQSYRPPPLFRLEPFAPYAIGLVELPEGLRVLGMLAGCPLESIRIGMEVELSTGTLYRNDAGQDVLTYQFVPAGGSGSAS